MNPEREAVLPPRLPRILRDRCGALDGYAIRRAALTAAAVTAVVMAVSSAGQAAAGYPDGGVVLDPTGVTVTSVSPRGFVWRDGIRPGQRVVELHSSNEPGGWRLTTTDGSHTFVSASAPFEEALRGTLPLAVAGLVAAAVAVLFLRANRRWVLPMATISLLASSVPFSLMGDDVAAASLAIAAAVPGTWVVARIARHRLVATAAAVALAALFVAWWVTRIGDMTAWGQLESWRGLVALLGVAAMILDRTFEPIRAGGRLGLVRPRLADIAMVAAVAAIALGLVDVLNVSPVIVGGGLVVLTLAVPTVRGLPGNAVGASLTADLRERAAAEAVEAERARIAREIHDSPLQQLAAVIRRLELVPQASDEVAHLRGVADELRVVATDLRPPVLDDLGLGAAIESLAEQSNDRKLPVVADVLDASRGDPRRRAPAIVELAVFRIVQEAVANALQHANSSRIWIEGRIDESRADISIRDDGRGIEADAVTTAAARGRLGLASMRRRAQAIDAELSIDGSATGTTVHVEWRR